MMLLHDYFLHLQMAMSRVPRLQDIPLITHEALWDQKRPAVLVKAKAANAKVAQCRLVILSAYQGLKESYEVACALVDCISEDIPQECGVKVRRATDGPEVQAYDVFIKKFD